MSAPAASGDIVLPSFDATPSCHFGPLVIHYDERVLAPRLWTWQQSEWAVELCADAEPGPLLELCAGVGHIGLAAAVFSDRDLVQVEVDPVAASYARSNAALAGWANRTKVRNSGIETALRPDERFGVIIADPPYLQSAELERWAEDPPTAIDGGADGLDLLRSCVHLAALHLAKHGQLLLQTAGPAQNEQIAELVGAAPTRGLTCRDERVIDDERAIMRISRVGL